MIQKMFAGTLCAALLAAPLGAFAQPPVLPPVPRIAPGYTAPDAGTPEGDIIGGDRPAVLEFRRRPQKKGV